MARAKGRSEPESPLFEPPAGCLLTQQVKVKPAFIERASVDEQVRTKADTLPVLEQRLELALLVRASLLLSGIVGY